MPRVAMDEAYAAGHLSAALAAAAAGVEQQPSDDLCRSWLWQLLCFAGQWEQADQQLQVLAQQQPDAADDLNRFRQLLRAEALRQEVFERSGTPQFLGAPTPSLQMHLQALAALRTGQASEAARLCAQAELQRPAVSGCAEGQTFNRFRDMDDLTSGFLEVFTPDGAYYWIPVEAVVNVEFRPPAWPIHRLWRRAHMAVTGGSEAEVFLPALYPLTFHSPDDQLRLGRDTDWQGQAGEPIRGIGLRTFLIGEQDRSILDIEQLRFDTPV